MKYNTVAKLYFNLGEVDLALKYLDKFLEVRGTSAHAFKFRGQILEKSLEKSSDPEALHSKRRAALDAFKTTFDLDQSQKEVLLKICDLYYHLLPLENIDIVRYVFSMIFLKIHNLSKNSHIENPNFYKIHLSEISYFTKFTSLKSNFSQN